MHVDLHVELHDVENSRPADSAPYFTRLTRFGFNWRAPLRKNVKSSCSSRQKTSLWRDTLRKLSRHSLFFPLSFLFPLTNFFPLTISRPPRGYVKTKKVLHTFGTAPFRHSSTYLLCQSLGIDPVDEARKSDRVPNMFKLTDPGHNPLQSHPEPRVRNATKLSQIQIPRVAL